MVKVLEQIQYLAILTRGQMKHTIIIVLVLGLFALTNCNQKSTNSLMLKDRS